MLSVEDCRGVSRGICNNLVLAVQSGGVVSIGAVTDVPVGDPGLLFSTPFSVDFTNSTLRGNKVHEFAWPLKPDSIPGPQLTSLVLFFLLVLST